MKLIIKEWINIFKGTWSFVNRYSIGRNESIRRDMVHHEVPDIREVGKQIMEENKELFWKLRVSELEDQNKELKRQNEVISSWFVSKTEYDDLEIETEACRQKLGEAKEVMSMLEADVETWKQMYLKARASGYQEGLEQAAEDAKRSKE